MGFNSQDALSSMFNPKQTGNGAHRVFKIPFAHIVIAEAHRIIKLGFKNLAPPPGF